MNKKIAILILNYNSQTYLNNCLLSINKQSFKQFDTFFIDNNSTDNSVDFISKRFPNTKIIKHPKNYGVGKGFNLAIKQLINDYDYFCLFNPDVVLSTDYIKNSYNSFIKDPLVDIVSCNSIFQHNHLIDNIGGKIINIFLGVFGGRFTNHKFSEIPQYYQNHPSPIFYALITGMMIKKSTFTKFGFFDEDYFMYFEDIDFSWRIQLGGGKIIANPKAILYHYGHGSIKNKSTQNKILGLIEINLLTTYYKNLSNKNILLILPITILSRILMSLFYFFISPQITSVKIISILKFIRILFINNRIKLKRNLVQKTRKLNDLEVFKKNPGSVLSIKPILFFFFKWFGFIKSYNQKLAKY